MNTLACCVTRIVGKKTIKSCVSDNEIVIYEVECTGIHSPQFLPFIKGKEPELQEGYIFYV